MSNYKRRIKKFVEEEKEIKKALCDLRKIAYVEKDVKTTFFEYENKMNDNKELVSYLENVCLNSNGKMLILASETGSGKTYTIDKLNINVDNIKVGDTYKILVLPNTANVDQVSEHYNFVGVRGGVDIGSIDFKKQHDFAVIVDRIQEFVSYIPNSKINIFIDEAQVLINDSCFRSAAMLSAIKTIEELVNNGNNVFLTSATFEILSYFDFDEVVCCYKENDTKKSKLVIKTTKNTTFNSFVVDTIKSNKSKSFVRYNSTTTTNVVDNLKAQNFDAKRVSSNDKNNNEIYDAIINDESLPQADVWFTTSLLDAGCNITSVNGKKENIVPMFCCQTSKQINLMNIEQFFNRVRYNICEYQLILKYNEPIENEKLTLSECITKASKDLKSYLNSFKLYLDSIKVRKIIEYGYELENDKMSEELNKKIEEEIEQEIKSVLSFKTADGRCNNFNCIYFENGEIKYNEIQFFKKAYEDYYMKQFFYKYDALIEELKERLSISEVIIENYDEKLETLEKMISKNVSDSLDDYIENNGDIDINKREYKEFSQSIEYDLLKSSETLGLDNVEVANMLVEGNTRIVKEMITDKVAEAARNFDFSKLNDIEAEFYKGLEVFKTSIIYDKINKKLNELKGFDDFGTQDKEIFFMLGDKTIKEVEEKLFEKQCIIVNKMFLNNQVVAPGMVGSEQIYFINTINNLFGNEDYLILDKEDLKDIAKCMGKSYKPSKVEKLIKGCYSYRFVESGSNSKVAKKKLRVNNKLKLK